MCFSAPASFVAGVALSAAGMATIRMASRRPEIAFAAIPLLFGIQQLTEGLIWLSFDPGSLLPNAPLTQFYSLFSHVLWPMFIPFAVCLLETVRWRKQAILACQVVGTAVGLYLLYGIVRSPVISRVVEGHIAYESPHFYVVPVMLAYLTATCASSLFSGNRIIRTFGAVSLAAFIAAYAIHVATFLSVWCFFAAVMSFIVYLYFSYARAPAADALRGVHR